MTPRLLSPRSASPPAFGAAAPPAHASPSPAARRGHCPSPGAPLCSASPTCPPSGAPAPGFLTEGPVALRRETPSLASTVGAEHLGEPGEGSLGRGGRRVPAAWSLREGSKLNSRLGQEARIGVQHSTQMSY
nr:transcription initiation factor TFIID subunit 4-like [Marmota flaviventris]